MNNNVFEQMAKRYDTQERMDLADVIVQQVSPQLQNSSSKVLLDYGSGTGLVSLKLAGLVDSVLLVDSSAQMVDVVKGKIAREGVANAEVLVSDFTQETPDIQVDVILVSLVLLHIPETDKILKALFDALKDEGQLLIVDFDKNDSISHPKVHNGFEHGELKTQLMDAGFKSTSIETVHHGKHLFMNQDASMFLSKSTK